MKEVYILKVQGWGDGSEDEYVNVGVFTSMVNLEMAQRNLIAEALEDGLEDVVTDIEIWEVDA